jgi:hypothetical protein
MDFDLWKYDVINFNGLIGDLLLEGHDRNEIDVVDLQIPPLDD